MRCIEVCRSRKDFPRRLKSANRRRGSGGLPDRRALRRIWHGGRTTTVMAIRYDELLCTQKRRVVLKDDLAQRSCMIGGANRRNPELLRNLQPIRPWGSHTYWRDSDAGRHQTDASNNSVASHDGVIDGCGRGLGAGCGPSDAFICDPARQIPHGALVEDRILVIEGFSCAGANTGREALMFRHR